MSHFENNICEKELLFSNIFNYSYKDLINKNSKGLILFNQNNDNFNKGFYKWKIIDNLSYNDTISKNTLISIQHLSDNCDNVSFIVKAIDICIGFIFIIDKDKILLINSPHKINISKNIFLEPGSYSIQKIPCKFSENWIINKNHEVIPAFFISNNKNLSISYCDNFINLKSLIDKYVIQNEDKFDNVIYQSFKQNINCDVNLLFKIGKSEFKNKCHKLMLFLKSNYFENIKDIIENETIILNLSDIGLTNDKIITSFFNFIYKNQIYIPVNEIINENITSINSLEDKISLIVNYIEELYKLSDFLDIPNLMNILLNLKKDIDREILNCSE